MASDHLRASDSDRDAVVSVLRDAYTAGRLTLEEFDERTSSAYAGKTWGELRELTRDLPEEPELGTDIPQSPFSGDPLPPVPRPDVSRGFPVQRSQRRARLAPILVIWVIAGLASHSVEVAGVLVLVGLVVLLSSSFASGWRDDDRRRRDDGDQRRDDRH